MRASSGNAAKKTGTYWGSQFSKKALWIASLLRAYVGNAAKSLGLYCCWPLRMGVSQQQLKLPKKSFWGKRIKVPKSLFFFLRPQSENLANAKRNYLNTFSARIWNSCITNHARKWYSTWGVGECKSPREGKSPPSRRLCFEGVGGRRWKGDQSGYVHASRPKD